MTRQDRDKLEALILQIVSTADPWQLYLHCDSCGGAGFNDKRQFVWVSANNVSPYIAKKLGYTVRKDVIKHALAPLTRERGDSWFLVERVCGSTCEEESTTNGSE